MSEPAKDTLTDAETPSVERAAIPEKPLFARGLGAELTSIDLLKALAIVTMIIDHTGYYFFPDESWWRLVGRFSAPIWLFLIGYALNQPIPKRLVIAAGLLVLVDAATMEPLLPLNILASIIFVRLALPIITKPDYLKPENLLPISVLLACLALPSWFSIEYGVLCLLMGLFGHLCRQAPEDKAALGIVGLAISAVYIGWQPLVFEFDRTQQIILAIGTIIMLYGLTRFRKTTLTGTSTLWYAPTLRLFGRYSLEIYVLHITLFCALAFTQMDHSQFAFFLVERPDYLTP